MKRLTRLHAALGLAAMLAVAGSASAQGMYRCNNGGSVYFSDKPCTNNGKLGAMSAAPSRQEWQPNDRNYAAPLPKAADHLVYLSAECASLNEALRTAPSRGLRGQALADLHGTYREKCSDEDDEARRKLRQRKSAERSERQAEQTAQQQAQAQVALGKEQCHEMLRILHGKRQRTDALTDGERRDLQRFEASYQERCKGR
jgi:hypothetical protein